MKKIICAAIAAVMLLPVGAANAGNDDWVAPLIGGLVIGGIIGSNSHPHPHYYGYDDYYAPPPPPRKRCWEQDVYDGWGNWVGTRTVCRRYYVR